MARRMAGIAINACRTCAAQTLFAILLRIANGL